MFKALAKHLDDRISKEIRVKLLFMAVKYGSSEGLQWALNDDELSSASLS